MNNPLAILLHYANARPPYRRVEFYALKDRLLRRFARQAGTHWQCIRKKCWGPYGLDGGIYGRIGCQGAECPNCDGKGIYLERWIQLEVWQWGSYTFHHPIESYGWPDPHPEMPDIFGYIRHVGVSYERSKKARLLLYLLSGAWRLLWLELKDDWPELRKRRFTYGRVTTASDDEELPF